MELLYLSREYPKGGDYFRDRLRAAFARNKAVEDPKQIKALIARGEYMAREVQSDEEVLLRGLNCDDDTNGSEVYGSNPEVT